MQIKKLKFESINKPTGLFSAKGLNGDYNYYESWYKTKDSEDYSRAWELFFNDIRLVIVPESSTSKEIIKKVLEYIAQDHHDSRLIKYLENN